MGITKINTDPTRRDLNLFGFIWLGFMTFFGAVAWFHYEAPRTSVVLWLLAIVVPVIGWIFPRFMRAVFVGMSYAAWPIGFVVSHVVLALVYYLVLTPIGLSLRVFGYDPMQRRVDTEAKTYWIERDATIDAKRYFRQF